MQCDSLCCCGDLTFFCSLHRVDPPTAKRSESREGHLHPQERLWWCCSNWDRVGVCRWEQQQREAGSGVSVGGGSRGGGGSGSPVLQLLCCCAKAKKHSVWTLVFLCAAIKPVYLLFDLSPSLSLCLKSRFLSRAVFACFCDQ